MVSCVCCTKTLIILVLDHKWLSTNRFIVSHIMTVFENSLYFNLQFYLLCLFHLLSFIFPFDWIHVACCCLHNIRIEVFCCSHNECILAWGPFCLCLQFIRFRGCYTVLVLKCVAGAGMCRLQTLLIGGDAVSVSKRSTPWWRRKAENLSPHAPREGFSPWRGPPAKLQCISYAMPCSLTRCYT